MLEKLRTEVNAQVNAAIAAKESTEIAGVRLAIIPLPSGVVVQTCGDTIRVDDGDRQAQMTVFALVFDAIKTEYRELGPDAALAALQK